MPRPLRNFVENGVYHLTSRGVDRLTIFRDDADREKFLELVEKVVVERGWSCLSYCLMDNHYHLLIRTPVPDLAAGMQYINGQYARYFNNRHGRSGHLFQGRYHHAVVEDDIHLLETARYIPLNPVRAGMTRTAAEWKWSSHNTVTGRARAAWVDIEDLLARFAAYFGGDPTSARGYEKYVATEERWSARQAGRRRHQADDPRKPRRRKRRRR